MSVSGPELACDRNVFTFLFLQRSLTYWCPHDISCYPTLMEEEQQLAYVAEADEIQLLAASALENGSRTDCRVFERYRKIVSENLSWPSVRAM